MSREEGVQEITSLPLGPDAAQTENMWGSIIIDRAGEHAKKGAGAAR